MNKDDDFKNLTKQADILHSKRIEEYRKTANLPDFKTPEEYHAWQKTPAGKKHMKAIEKIDKEVEKLITGKGGKRDGAGRKPTEDKAKNRTIRLNDEDFKKFKTLGGVKFLRHLIQKHFDEEEKGLGIG